MSIIVDTSNFKTGFTDWQENTFTAGNPQFLQWKWDGSGTVKEGRIGESTLATIFAGLQQNSEGVFSFDLSIFAREAIKKINPNFTQTETWFRNNQGFTARIEVSVAVKVDGTFVSETVDFLIFLPAVNQIGPMKGSLAEYAVNVSLPDDKDQKALMPNDTNDIMVFLGYPIEFNYYFTRRAGEFLDDPLYQIAHKVNGNFQAQTSNVPIEIEEGVFSSYGIFKLDEEKLNSPNYTVVIRQIADGLPNRDVNVNFKLHYRNECGVYLRWLNSKGGWSYWLFGDKVVTQISGDDTNSIQQWTPNPMVERTSQVLQKSKTKQLVIGTDNLEDWMFRVVTDVLFSRNVYMYTRDRYDIPRTSPDNVPILTEEDFTPVKVRDWNISPDRESRLKAVSITIELPNQYTNPL